MKIRSPLMVAFCSILLGSTTLVLDSSATDRSARASQMSCNNPSRQLFNPSPRIFAPDETRGKDIVFGQETAPQRLVELRPGCLPISIRYNNPGAIKTPSSGPWPGQIARDSKGHAVFATVADGTKAWITWMLRRAGNRPTTLFRLMSIYAPPTDCVGSVGTPPNCPHGVNPTRQYATRIARRVGLTADQSFVLNPRECAVGRELTYQLLAEIMTFEAGAGFCGGSGATCRVDREIFEAAADEIAGPVEWGPCSDPPAAHEQH